MSDKATIYQSRRECLIASVGDSRRVFTATYAESGHSGQIWGLATTEHAFLVAVAVRSFGVTKLTRDDLQSAMADELTGGEK